MHLRVSNTEHCLGLSFHCSDDVALERVSASWLRSTRALNFSRRRQTGAEAGSLLGLAQTVPRWVTKTWTWGPGPGEAPRPALLLRVPGSVCADAHLALPGGGGETHQRGGDHLPLLCRLPPDRAGWVSLPLGKPPEPSGLWGAPRASLWCQCLRLAPSLHAVIGQHSKDPGASSQAVGQMETIKLFAAQKRKKN